MMRFRFRRRILGMLAVIVLASSGAAGSVQAQKTATLQDVKAYGEAREWFRKAEDLIGTAKENSEEQADLFRKAITLKPDFIEAHFNLGLILIHQKKTEGAAEEFEAVRKINPDFEANGESIHQLLSVVYRELGKNAEALAALHEGLKKQPKSLSMLKALAYLQVHAVQDTEAVPTLQAILDIDPLDTDARINLAILLQKLRRHDEAMQNYRLVIEQNPSDFSAHFNLAILLMSRNQVEDAIQEFERADKISPGNEELLERLGDAYISQDRLEKAAQSFRAAAEKAPERAVLLSKLAFVLAQLKRIPDAVAVLEKSVRIAPGSADAFYLLGDLYSELGRYDDSVIAYNRSLKLNPKQREVRYNLGTLYAESKLFREARTELKAAVEIDPDYAAAWSNLAVVCERLELDKEAIEANEKVVMLGKALAGNYFRLGILYAKDNQPDPAIANFARAIQMEPEKYRQILREELKNVHSVLDSVRYKDAFIRLLSSGSSTPPSPAIKK